MNAPGADAAIEQLSKKLHAHRDNSSATRDVFLEHLKSDFLAEFVGGELRSLASDPDHIVPHGVGQVSFKLINTNSFDYTVRISPANPARPHLVTWSGDRHILSVKGPGVASIRVLRAPDHIAINRFQRDVHLEHVEHLTLTHGSYAESASSRDILDVCETESPVIFEVLTARSNDAELTWTFDEHLVSTFAEPSVMAVSRIQNVLEVAHRMGKGVPDDVYDAMLKQGNTQIKLLAIRSLLVTKTPTGFYELQRAIDSEIDTLSEGAQSILDALTPKPH